jgi:hypothetical protein
MTKQPAGPHAVAVYVDNSLGRRLLVAPRADVGYAKMVTLATTQAEARDVIAALRQLAEELPP